MVYNFTDLKNRQIQINVGDDSIEGFHNDRKIAEFQYNITEFEYKYFYELYLMNVDIDYQHSGIGSKIIELGQQIYEHVTYPQNTWDRNANHLSNEGLQLIQSCINKKILPETVLYEPSEEEYCPEYEDYPY